MPVSFLIDSWLSPQWHCPHPHVLEKRVRDQVFKEAVETERLKLGDSVMVKVNTKIYRYTYKVKFLLVSLVVVVVVVVVVVLLWLVGCLVCCCCCC